MSAGSLPSQTSGRAAAVAAAPLNMSGIRSWFSTRAATPAHRTTHPHARCATNTSGLQTSATLAAYRAFFFTTAYFNFWGSNDHVAKFIESVHSVSEAVHLRGSLIDVGAAPYNVIGGDVSHFLVYLRQWGCSAERGLLMGFEPMQHDYMRLVRAVRQQIAKDAPLPSTAPLRLVRASPTEHVILDAAGARCASLRNHPVSDRAANVTIAPQPNAGSNTASLNPHYQDKGVFSGRPVRAVSVDEELARLGQAEGEVLVLKVDVEGHEVAVLDGARAALRAGRVHVVLLEYGDKMAVEIYDAMKQKFAARAAAPAPQSIRGLHWLRGYADDYGYDVFLLGAARGVPVLVGVSGALWDDEYEVCLDKRRKWSNDGRLYFNYSSWSPNWSAVCWYDLVLLRRTSPLYAPLALDAAKLPRSFCKRLEGGWCPARIQRLLTTATLNVAVLDTAVLTLAVLTL